MLGKLYTNFKNSYRGLQSAWRLEWAFRMECLVLVCALPAAFYLGKNALEILLLLGSITMILVLELLNSAIETTVDRIGLEQHALSGQAKDMASAAILVMIILAAAVWLTMVMRAIPL